MKWLARKRCRFVFICLDGGPEGADETDARELEADAILSIKGFTRALFPDGVP